MQRGRGDRGRWTLWCLSPFCWGRPGNIRSPDQAYIEHCSHLQGSQVRVDGEYVDQLEGGEDVGGSEKTLRDEGGVPVVPLLPRQRHGVVTELGLPQYLTNIKWQYNERQIFRMLFKVGGCFYKTFLRWNLLKYATEKFNLRFRIRTHSVHIFSINIGKWDNSSRNLHQSMRQSGVQWWPRRGSWWWSPRHSTCRWCIPGAPRPRAAWSRSRWGRPPRPGCSSPPDSAGSPAWWRCLPTTPTLHKCEILCKNMQK